MNALRNKALSTLLCSKSIAEAAQNAGISERTIYNYLHDDEFLKEYRTRCEALLQEATGKAQKSMTAAVTVLQEIATDKKCPTAARVAAARSLIEYGFKSFEVMQLLPRIEELERTAGI